MIFNVNGYFCKVKADTSTHTSCLWDLAAEFTN